MNNNRTTTATIILDGKQAEAELTRLSSQVDVFANKMNKARKANDKAGFDKARQQYKAAKTEMSSYKKSVMDVTQVLNNLNGSTMKQLSATQRKLQNEVNNLNRSTKEEIALYDQKVAQLKLVKTQLSTLRSEMNATSMQSKSLASKLADGFNKYSMVVMSTIAALTGVILAFRKAVDASNEYQASVANLSALTGLAGQELEWLSKKALDTSGSMTEAGIRITTSAQDIVDAYTQMGSKRPELLKDKEALASVTQSAIVLSTAAKMELVPATNALAIAMNQFNAKAVESDRYINVIAAGSKVGAGNVEYLAEALEKSGTAASGASLSIEENIAAIETIAPKFAKATVAGRSLRNIFTILMQSSDAFNPSVVGLSKALENLENAHLNTAEKVKLFKMENLNAAEALIRGRKEYNAYLNAVTATNTATEQAIKNSNTRKAQLEAARARVAKLTIELGEKLAPALTFSTSAFGKIIKSTLALIQFFKEYGKEIAVVSLSVVAYALAVKVQAKWDSIHYAMLVAKEALTKAYGVSVNVLTGKIKMATIAQKAWNLIQKANPIGLVIGLLTAAGTALYFYSQRLSAAELTQKELNEAQATAQKNMVGQKIEMERLLRIARDEQRTKEERLQAVKDLNSLSPEYLGNLSLETINTKAAKEATDQYILALEKKARVEAARERLQEIEKDLIDLRLSGQGAELSFMDKLSVAASSLGNSMSVGYHSAIKYADNLATREKELLAVKEGLLSIIDQTNQAEASSDQSASGEKDPNVPKIKTLSKLREELALLKKDREQLDITDKQALANNTAEIKAKEALIATFDNLIAKQQESAALKFDPTKLQSPMDYDLGYEQMKYDTLRSYRTMDIKDMEETYKREKAIAKTAFNDQLVALGKNEQAKKALREQFKKEELKRDMVHLESLRTLFEEQLSDISLENSLLSDQEKESLLTKIEDIKVAISGLKVLQSEEDEESPSLLSQILFGGDTEATLSEKISAIGWMAQDAFNSINAMITNAENRQLQEYLKTNEQKKKALDNRLKAGQLSEERYQEKIKQMEEEADARRKKLAYEQAKRQKAAALLNAIINTAVAVTGALGNPVGPAGIIMAAIVGALGTIQIAAIASEPLPQYASGNYLDVIGADDGRTYKAKKGNNKTRLVKTPTYEPGLGLVGEEKPEIVFSGADTETILNTPQLVRAINHTLGVPRFAEGNYNRTISESTTYTSVFTDPLLIAVLEKVNNKLDQPARAELVADEDYIRLHQESLDDFEAFRSRVN